MRKQQHRPPLKKTLAGTNLRGLLHARVGLDDPRVRLAQTPIRTSPTRLNRGSC